MSINVGDLVMVVKPQPCCGNAKSVGMVFEVTSISIERTHCTYCLETRNHLVARGKSDGRLTRVSRLVKIDPPSPPESLEREKELSV